MSHVESFVRFCESDFGAAVMDREAAYLGKLLDSSDRVLDVGAGIGSIEERLPDHGIVGLDLSEDMVRTARSRADGQFVVGVGPTAAGVYVLACLFETGRARKLASTESFSIS